ncbi:MAG: hypothetical protein QOD10_2666, partial [Mycobacterium sp.]|nr:hypothetical protein [Mycobacterium sp.]
MTREIVKARWVHHGAVDDYRTTNRDDIECLGDQLPSLFLPLAVQHLAESDKVFG